jgi:hypothetical protein
MGGVTVYDAAAMVTTAEEEHNHLVADARAQPRDGCSRDR